MTLLPGVALAGRFTGPFPAPTYPNGVQICNTTYSPMPQACGGLPEIERAAGSVDGIAEGETYDQLIKAGAEQGLTDEETRALFDEWRSLQEKTADGEQAMSPAKRIFVGGTLAAGFKPEEGEVYWQEYVKRESENDRLDEEARFREEALASGLSPEEIDVAWKSFQERGEGAVADEELRRSLVEQGASEEDIEKIMAEQAASEKPDEDLSELGRAMPIEGGEDCSQYCPNGVIQNGMCKTTICYQTAGFVVGPQAGDVMFHWPLTGAAHDNAPFPSPLGVAQSYIMPDRPTHTSVCSTSSNGRCLRQAHNDVGVGTLGPTIAQAKIMLNLGPHCSLNTPFGTFTFNCFAPTGVGNLGLFTAMDGTADVAFGTTHKGQVSYYHDTTIASTSAPSQIDLAPFGIGQVKYRLGGVSTYYDRSQCSETAAAVKNVSPDEGYRTFRFSPTQVNQLLPGLHGAVVADLYANVTVKKVKGAIDALANINIGGGFFLDAFVALSGVLNNNIGQMLNHLNSAGFNLAGVNHIFEIFGGVPNFLNMSGNQLLESMSCRNTNIFGMVKVESSLRCVGNRFQNAFASTIFHLTTQSLNLMLDVASFNIDRWWVATWFHPAYVLPESHFTRYTATGDFYVRLARSAANNPCDPNNVVCTF